MKGTGSEGHAPPRSPHRSTVLSHRDGREADEADMMKMMMKTEMDDEGILLFAWLATVLMLMMLVAVVMIMVLATLVVVRLAVLRRCSW